MTESTKSIAQRSLQANNDMVDLTDYYTHSLKEDRVGSINLSALPFGVQVFAEAAFDVRGLIRLGGTGIQGKPGETYPRAVEGIAVHFTGKKLYFLHGTVGRVEDDTKVGEYVLHYTNGKTRRIPIVYQRQLADCAMNEALLPTDADVAWTSESKQDGYAAIQLYRYTANNPCPNEEIATIDFVSTMTESAPFLVALTLEPLEHAYEEFSMASIDSFCPIAPRSQQAGPALVDLSQHYTSSMDDNWFHHAGHDLRDVPRGVQVMEGVEFDIRGLVQLAASKTMDVTGVVFPEAVKGIAVNHKGTRLHFLQACFWNTVEGAELGNYVIHYVDGQTRTAPIIYGQNILDWWQPGIPQLSGAMSVWQGSNPATRSMDLITHLIKYTWENPLPDVQISTIDIVSNLIEASPFLVAITVTE